MIKNFVKKLLLLIVLFSVALAIGGFDPKQLASVFMSATGGIMGLLAFEYIDGNLYIANNQYVLD